MDIPRKVQERTPTVEYKGDLNIKGKLGFFQLEGDIYKLLDHGFFPKLFLFSFVGFDAE